MKVIATALIAVLTTVLVLVGFSPRVGGKEPAAAVRQAATPAAFTTGTSQQALPASDWQAARGVVDSSETTAANSQTPVLVNCGPGTQTLVRPVMMNGEMVSQVECVADQRGYVQAGTMMRPVTQAVPVYDTESAAPPRVVRVQETPYRRPAPRRIEAKPRRSWGKTALVIGGSSAAGAGIGGLIGGKKGALIGAAIGGGASTIFEATKRR